MNLSYISLLGVTFTIISLIVMFLVAKLRPEWEFKNPYVEKPRLRVCGGCGKPLLKNDPFTHQGNKAPCQTKS